MRAPHLATVSCLFMIAIIAQPQYAGADMQYWLQNVPDYDWYNGCSPTAGGQMIGYWDNQPGYENMWDGSAPTGPETHDHPVYDMIASPEHIDETFTADQCTHSNAPNSVSCFMHTNPGNGGSTAWNIGAGLNQYAAWDDPNTSLNETSHFMSLTYHTPHAGWTSISNEAAFRYTDLVREIDAGRPVLLNLSFANGKGHSVTAYGYWIDDNGDEWFAVRDTWQDGISNDSTRGITAVGDSGVEWWRYDLQQEAASGGEEYFIDNAVPFVPLEDGPLVEVGDLNDEYAVTINSSAEMIYASLASETDKDWYHVYLEKNDRITVQTQDYEGFDGAIDTRLELWQADDAVGLDYNDNFFASTNTSGISWKAEEAGNYVFGVMAGATDGAPKTGGYNLAWYTAEAPEPATVLLLSLGLAGLIARRRGAAALSEE